MTLDSKYCRRCKLTVPLLDSVRLIPCGCILCKDCMIEFLFETRLELDLECCSCGEAVASHQAEQRSSCKPAAGSLDAKPSTNATKPTLQQEDESGQDSSVEREVTNDENEKTEAHDDTERKQQDSSRSRSKNKDNSTNVGKESSAKGSKGSKTKAKPAKKRKPAAKTPKKRKRSPKKVATEDDGTPKEKKPRAKKVRKIALDENGNPKYPKLLKPRPRKSFEQRMEDLLLFKSKFGHVRVPWNYAEDTGLGEWVKNVRRGVKKITIQQRKQLNEAGFIWETKWNKLDREWKEQFEKLKVFKRRFGNCLVPWNWSEDPAFKEWVHTQRKLNNKGQLREDRKKELESVGFAWRGRGSAASVKQKMMNDDDGTEWEDAVQNGFPSEFL